jgi:RNA polymerase sigma factor (sigma-70 family)
MDKFEQITGNNFNIFYEKEKLKLINFLLKRNSKYDIEGIVDTAFTKLYNNINKYDDTKGSLNTYLYTIAKNELFLIWKKDKIETLSLDYFQEEYGYDLRDDSEKYDISIDLEFEAQKSKINDSEYEELKLRLKGLSYKEISDKLNININTIKSRIKWQKKYIKNGKKEKLSKKEYMIEYYKKNKLRINEKNKKK